MSSHLLRLSFILTILLVLTPAVAQAADDFRLSPNLSELSQLGEHARTYKTMLVIFQVAAILFAAKLCGWLVEKVKIPGVIGELMAGVIIGPYLLGHLIHVPLHGHWVPLFPAPLNSEQWPINDIVWSMAQFASIILLFITGLHTDLRQFLRYMGPATTIAVLGLIAPFALGTGVVYIPFFADLARHDVGQSVLVPALFVGAILAATSIGITARVLGDIGKLDTPEGVTIIGAAVLDDVLGIIALAIVGGIAATGSVSYANVGLIAGKAFGFWIALTALILILAKPIEAMIMKVKYAGAIVGFGLALAFVCSGAAEGFGLAFIIGAYSVGLGLSRTKLAHVLMDELRPINDFIVPIFFAGLGMLVNFNAMLSDWRIIVFGLVITAVAIIGKVVGCGVAAFGTGFNARGSYRIGLGMMPRGEVALIVAGIGLSQKIIQENVFGVSIMMTLLTTVLAPILLVPAFKTGGSGRRRSEEQPAPPLTGHVGIKLPVPADMGPVLLTRLLNDASRLGWKGAYDSPEQEMHVLRNGEAAAEVRLLDGAICIDTEAARQDDFVKLLVSARQSIARDITAAAPITAKREMN